MIGSRIRSGTAIVALLLACSTAAGDSLREKNVLALYWYGRDTADSVLFDRGLQRTLQSDETGTVNYYAEYLETNRLPGQQQSHALYDYLLAKYAGLKIDVLVAESEPALKFLLDNRPRLVPDIPIVYFSGKRPDIPRESLAHGTTGVIAEGAVARTLDVALKLHPATTRAFVVTGTPAKQGQALEACVRRELEPFERLVTLVYLTDRPMQELIRTVKSASDAVVLYIRPAGDAPGRTPHQADTFSLLAAASPVPVYGVAAEYVGRGAVGGYVVDHEAVGAQIGEMALRLTHGAAPQDIPVATAVLTPVFDWRQIERWNIRESLLPAGRVIQFQEPGLWAQHSQWALFLSIGLGLGIFGSRLWLERGQRRRAGDESRSHLAAMVHMDRRAALGELTAWLTHELAQPLSAILRSAETAKLLLTSGAATDGEIETIVDDIRKSDKRASEIIRRTRSLLRRKEMETSMVDLNAVARDVVDLVASDVTRKNVRVDLDTSSTPCVVEGDRVHLEQVLLNLIVNGLDAMNDVPRDRRQLVVRTRPVNARVAVSVHDTGPGIPDDALPHIFDPFFTTKGDGMGMGLSIVRTIVEAHRGRIVAENNSDQGATVRFSLPCYPSGTDGPYDAQPV